MNKKLNPLQIEKLTKFINRINEVEGNNISFSESTLSVLTGVYKLIETKGNGDPIKAANWRLKLRGSI